MFHAARLRLTAWYLFIILCISLFFSVVIYQSFSRQIERSLQRRQIIFHAHVPQSIALPPTTEFTIAGDDLIAEAKENLRANLFIIDLTIVALSGVIGYFLAGRTLQPISQMVEEQKRFTADASHELRTPLTAMQTEIEVALRDKELSLASSKSLLHSNLEEINKLRLLTDSLLTLSRQHELPNTASFKQVSLREVVYEAEQKVQPFAKKRSMVFEHDIPDISVYGDKKSLVELMVIFLDNAVKYGFAKSTVTITAKENSDAEITVQNHGEGIDPEDLPFIFNRFFRSNTARTKIDGGGHGLGLAIAKQIIEKHHGSVTVESIPGGTTSFIITLPLDTK